MNYVMHREILNLLKISTVEKQKKKIRIKIDRNFERKYHSKFVFEIRHFEKTNSTSHVFAQNISKNVVNDNSQTVVCNRKIQKKLSTSKNRTNDVTILIRLNEFHYYNFVRHEIANQNAFRNDAFDKQIDRIVTFKCLKLFH